MVEEDRFDLDAVHRDDPASGVWIGEVRVDRRDVELAPVADLAIQGYALVLQRVEHVCSLVTAAGWRGRAPAAPAMSPFPCTPLFVPFREKWKVKRDHLCQRPTPAPCAYDR